MNLDKKSARASKRFKNAFFMPLVASAALGMACHAQTTPTPETQGAKAASAVDDSRPELVGLLPSHRLLGKTRLKVWGFQVYDARLWVAPGFKPDQFANEPFALELAYLRDFTSTEIAERSLTEMRRSATISEEKAKTWITALMRVLPEVKKGDRITGINRVGEGAIFLVNGKRSGEIRDAEFARLFFGIWLSPKTSEPQMRSALLAEAP